MVAVSSIALHRMRLPYANSHRMKASMLQSPCMMSGGRSSLAPRRHLSSPTSGMTSQVSSQRVNQSFLEQQPAYAACRAGA